MTTATQPQHLQALQLANRIRLDRSRDKRALSGLPKAEGLRRVASILREPPEHWASARPRELLTTPHRVSTRFVDRLLNALDIHVNAVRTIGELTPRERGLLADRLEELAAP